MWSQAYGRGLAVGWAHGSTGARTASINRAAGSPNQAECGHIAGSTCLVSSSGVTCTTTILSEMICICKSDLHMQASCPDGHRRGRATASTKSHTTTLCPPACHALAGFLANAGSTGVLVLHVQMHMLE